MAGSEPSDERGASRPSQTTLDRNGNAPGADARSIAGDRGETTDFNSVWNDISWFPARNTQLRNPELWRTNEWFPFSTTYLNKLRADYECSGTNNDLSKFRADFECSGAYYTYALGTTFSASERSSTCC